MAAKSEECWRDAKRGLRNSSRPGPECAQQTDRKDFQKRRRKADRPGGCAKSPRIGGELKRKTVRQGTRRGIETQKRNSGTRDAHRERGSS